MQHTYRMNDLQMTYYMPAEVDHHVAESLRQFLDAQIDDGRVRQLVFDFSETKFMDSSGIGVVIGRSRKLALFGGTVEAVHVGERIQKLFQVSGVGRVVRIREE